MSLPSNIQQTRAGTDLTAVDVGVRKGRNVRMVICQCTCGATVRVDLASWQTGERLPRACSKCSTSSWRRERISVDGPAKIKRERRVVLWPMIESAKDTTAIDQHLAMLSRERLPRTQER